MASPKLVIFMINFKSEFRNREFNWCNHSGVYYLIESIYTVPLIYEYLFLPILLRNILPTSGSYGLNLLVKVISKSIGKDVYISSLISSLIPLTHLTTLFSMNKLTNDGWNYIVNTVSSYSVNNG